MNIAILLYPGFTALDVVGPYEAFVQAPGTNVMFVAKEKGLVISEKEVFKIKPSHTFEEVEEADILIVPGGLGDVDAANDPTTINWIKKIHTNSRYTTSVCTGALILAKAGLLKGMKATTHWAAADALEALGCTYKAQRWVQNGKIVTAAGVSAGIDMTFFLLGDLMGETVAKALQLGIEYDPQPPFDHGSVAKAEPHIHKALAAGLHIKMGARYPELIADGA